MSRSQQTSRGAPGRTQKKRRRQRFRFQPGAVIFIWFITFLSCFALYMVSANLFEDDTPVPHVPVDDPAGTTTVSAQTTTAATTTAPVDKPLVNPVPESAARSATYLNDCVFIGDSITQGLADYQLIPMKNVLAGIGMNLSKIMTEKMTTSYGSCTAVEAVTQAKPTKIYVMLGSNGIAWMQQTEMIAEYTALLDALHTAAPEARIYILSIPPVTAGREVAAEGPITNAAVDAYNSALLALANQYGYYFVDVNTALKGNDGKLPTTDANADGIHFKTATYKLFLNYILKHTGA